MTEQDRPASSDVLSDEQSMALEKALFGTSQQLMAVIDSDGWGTVRGRAELLKDVRKRMEATSLLIENWLTANRS